MIEKQARIALLIDADNSPSSKIDVILAELSKLGVTNIRRAYGNWKKDGLKGWESVLHEYAIRPIQQFDYTKGKNATDMGLVIDAMDLLYTDQPDAFGIVSSDSDFTPLVMHLRAKGALVFGFGAKKTPMPFVNACSRFLFLENLGQGIDGGEAPAAPASPKAKSGAGRRPKAAKAEETTAVDIVVDAPPIKLDRKALTQDARLVSLLRNAAESTAGDDGWSPLGALGQHIGNQASFDPRNYGYKKLSDLIEATGLFDNERRGTHLYVRDKRQAKAGRG
jgi:uncharacterized LabA/DUF88 family protein